jgi:hypothetical protein
MRQGTYILYTNFLLYELKANTKPHVQLVLSKGYTASLVSQLSVDNALTFTVLCILLNELNELFWL